jgi:S-adenosylmethionine hydrolase
MREPRIITLLSDFGLKDVYVGVMKGIIATINPDAHLIDLTHQINPQDIVGGRFSLMNAYPHFPKSTVHLAVVDPGVGSKRRGVAIQVAGGYLVGPDNGLFSGILSFFPPLIAVSLTNKQYWYKENPSYTFHGRDIFAAVAAHLSQGIPIQILGDVIDPESLLRLSIPDLEINPEGIKGSIQYIDYFGNLITNIPQSALTSKNWTIKVGELIISPDETYSNVPLGELVAVVGSQGWVEIAVNGGSAQSKLGLGVGDSILMLRRTQRKT